MKVSIHGAICSTCQIPQLRDGFAELGHQHIDDYKDPDNSFLFVGNPPYDKFTDFAISKEKKTIFNVLDICWHCAELQQIVDGLKKNLSLADKVTCISKTVQASLKEVCDINADVIYYPMRPVKHTGVKKYPFRAMMAGRLRDPNKNATTSVQALIRAGFNESEVAIVGPEYIGWGVNMGEVSNEVLNDLYNSVDYLLCLDKNTGLALPPVEAACCGAIPIISSHLETFDEFWAQSPLGLNYQQCHSPYAISNLISSIENNPTWKAEIKQDMMAYGELAFRPKFEAKAVASRIIETYQMI